MLMSIVGQFDQNLKDLSKLTSTDVFFRGNSITCKGNEENTKLFFEAIKFLINKYFLTKIIEKEGYNTFSEKNIDLDKSEMQIFQTIN